MDQGGKDNYVDDDQFSDIKDTEVPQDPVIVTSDYKSDGLILAFAGTPPAGVKSEAMTAIIPTEKKLTEPSISTPTTDVMSEGTEASPETDGPTATHSVKKPSIPADVSIKAPTVPKSPTPHSVPMKKKPGSCGIRKRGNVGKTAPSPKPAITQALPRLSASIEMSPKGGTVPLPHIDGKICVPKIIPKNGLPASCKFEIGEHYFDPRILPKGTVPATFALWLQLSENYRLDGSITVTLSHYLDELTSKDGTALKLGVLKIDKNAAGEYEFKKIDTRVEVNGRYATFTLPNLCYSLLYAEVKPEEELGLKYCICPVFPSYERFTSCGQESSFFYYCLIYNDTKLRKIVEKQCREVKELKGHSVMTPKIIPFTSTRTLNWDDLQISYSLTFSNSGWSLIKHDPPPEPNIYPLENNIEDLEHWSENFIFPPSFKLEVCWGSPTPPKNDILKVTISSSDGLIKPATIEISSPLYSVPSSSSVPLSNAPLQQKMPVSCEYLIFVNHFEDIIDGIRFDSDQICHRLFGQLLITKAVRNFVFDVDTTEVQKATKIFNAMSDIIEQDRRNFLCFLEIISSKHNRCKFDGKPLKTLHGKLHCAYQASVISSLIKPFNKHREHIVSVIKSRSYGLKNVIHFLRQFSIPISSQSADCLVDEIVSKLRSSSNPHEMFDDVCASVAKANVNTRMLRADAAAELSRSRENFLRPC